MKKTIVRLGTITLVFILSFTHVKAQDFSDAPFKTSFSKTDVKVGDVVEIILKTDIADHLHIFGVKNECDGMGSKPPEWKKLSLNDASFVGPIYHGIKADELTDDFFNCLLTQFEHKAEFRQKIKITGLNPAVSGEFWYQMCSESLCKDFNVKLKIDAKTFNISEASKGAATPVQTPDVVNPKEDPATSPDATGTENPTAADTSSETVESNPASTDSSSNNATQTEEDAERDVENKGYWGLFLLGVLGGLGAIFTPCVYPMIPMTVAFFTKEKSKVVARKKALFYGVSILGIYVVLGVGLAWLFGDTFAYTLSTHWFPNILFFLVFFVFALSFLGMFELTLPSSFVNKMDAKGDKGGYIGIFFIAFTLVLVSFSCTAPIVGSVALLSADGHIIKAVMAMLGFALTFALPFTLFAFFPQWLNNMPQSGGWLNSIKVFLGFLELALSLKFLSQADLVYHWGILDRDVFLAAWIALSFLLGAYLLGKISFPHDSDLPRIPVPRFILAVVVITFGVYMVPGLWGAPLKPLAGFIPPLTTQDYNVQNGGGGEHVQSGHRFSDILHAAHNIDGYFDYNEALAAAKEQNKPILVDFTGHSCANCRKMEEYVWSEKPVLKQLKNDFIVLELLADEGFELPKNEWITNADGDILISLGQVNLHRQSTQFASNGQPYYYILDTNEKQLEVFPGYDPDWKKFDAFLKAGKAKFEAGKE